MATITLRSIKGTPLTIEEVDQNFTNLNTDVGTRLLASAYTASDVLTKLLTVDGTGSGLDADKLNGLSAAYTNTASTVVARDSSGSFAAQTITAAAFVGPLTGNVSGNVTGNLTGNSAGTHTGAVTGEVTGNTYGVHHGGVNDEGMGIIGTLTGNVTGNLTGNSTGIHTGNVVGNVTGNVTGNAGTVTNGLYSSSSYNNPSWLIGLAGSKVTSIPNSSLVNSSITINGTSVALGGSATIASGFGQGQTYQTPTRALQTEYTNSTANLIWVSVTARSNMGVGDINEANQYNELRAKVAGAYVARTRLNFNQYRAWLHVTFFVPAGSTYKVEFSHWETDSSDIGYHYGATLVNWTELR